MFSRFPVAVFVAVLACVVAPARGDVDTEVPLPAKLQGSLDQDEVEIVRFFAPQGSVLAAKLKTGKKDGVDPELRLLDPDGVEVPIPAANVKDKGASIAVKKLELSRSGTWALEVIIASPAC